MASRLWLRQLSMKCYEHPPHSSDSIKKITKLLNCTSTAAIPETLASSKIQVTPKVVSEILQKFKNAGLRTYYFFDWARRQNGYSHSQEAYHMMLNSLGIAREFGLMWSLLKEMQSKKVLTREAFRIIIKRYAIFDRLDEAVQAFEMMETFGLSADSEAFNDLLSALCKSGNVRKAQQVFDEMNGRQRYKPDLKSYSILLQGWGNEPNLGKVKEIFREMEEMGVELDVVAYGVIINAFCNGGKIEAALEMIDIMKSKGCFPNAHIYSILIHGYGSEKRIEDVIAVFRQMEKEGCNPDVPVFNALIGAFCKAKKLGQAYWVLDQMEAQGIHPNARTYSPILHCLMKDGCYEEAFKVFRRMVRKGCEPDLDAYCMALKTLFAEGNVDMAVRVWNRMRRKHCYPTKQAFVSFVNGLCEGGRMNEACVCFEEMLEHGIRAPTATFRRLRRGLLRLGRDDIVEDLSARLRELDN